MTALISVIPLNKAGARGAPSQPVVASNYRTVMRLVVLLLSVLLAALSFGAFLVPTGPWAVAVRVAIFVVVVAQAITSYLAIKSTSKAGAEARLEINDVLAPLAVALKNIPLETTARRRRTVVSFLTAATAVCIQLAEGPKLRATFFEVVDRDGSRAFAPTHLSVGRGDPPVSVFVEGDGGEGEEVWSYAREGRPRYEPDIKKSPPPHMDTSRPRKYRSFITMPVMVAGEPVGLLTINSPRKKGLTGDDVVPMRVVAELCATAVAANNGVCPPLGA